jgi:polysaccharide biosynthesis protein PslH
MKLVVCTNRLPALGKKGDQLLSYHRLRFLALSGHSIDLLYFKSLKDDLADEDLLRSFGIILHPITHSKIESIVNIFLAIFDSKLPFQCALFKSSSLKTQLNLLLTSKKPDILYFILVRSMANIQNSKCRVVVDMIDSLSLNLKRKINNSNFIIRNLLKIEYLRIKKFELSIANFSDVSFVVSNLDANQIPSKRIFVLPLGVDDLSFSRGGNFRSKTIIFTGNMNYGPNIEAVTWFVRNCWSHIKAAIPGVKFTIAGNNPDPSIINIGKSDDDILVTGFVSSIGQILINSAVAIAPMRSGAGMQNKILEAMASGVPLVVSSVGLGDIAAMPGKAVLVADSPEDFIASTVDLLTSPLEHQRMSDAAYEYVTNNHNWDVINNKFCYQANIF